MQLSPGCLVLAFALFHSAPQATVVEDFNHVERCMNSLYMGTPPRGIINDKLKKICQRYADKPRFVTLYDPQKRIPVYSAYSFKKTEGERRVDYSWMYETQLAEVDGNGNMLPSLTAYLHMKFEDSQAVLDDYSDVVLYERGHLNPDQHQSDPYDRAATYTLTNVVPEIREFNIGLWREHNNAFASPPSSSGNMIRRNNLENFPKTRMDVDQNLLHLPLSSSSVSPPHHIRAPQQRSHTPTLCAQGFTTISIDLLLCAYYNDYACIFNITII
ncbi:uncharacterized protein LOC112231376 [Oncorhynchus tshawytscha]|nr:uncharacterized protein LOC112231376 [Oncorhynchus tshawytscha]